MATFEFSLPLRLDRITNGKDRVLTVHTEGLRIIYSVKAEDLPQAVKMMTRCLAYSVPDHFYGSIDVHIDGMQSEIVQVEQNVAAAAQAFLDKNK